MAFELIVDDEQTADLRDSEGRLGLLFEKAPDPYFLGNLKGAFIDVNEAAEELTGYAREELIGQSFLKLKLSSPRQIAKVTTLIARNALGKDAGPDEFILTCKDGKQVPVEIRTRPVKIHGKRMVLGLARDITARKQAEEALRQSSQKIERLHQIAHDLEACKDEDQVYRLTVEAAERTLSFSVCTLCTVEEDRLVVKATSSKAPPHASQERELKKGGLAAKTYRTKETTIFGRIEDVPEAAPTQTEFKSGISTPVGDIGVFQVASTKANAFTDEDAHMIDLLLGHTYEAIRRIRLQEDLKHQAIHDPLTGVYNRRYFDETIETELQRSKRYNHPISFLMLDIDRFKEMNDRFGHQTGDKVLQTVASLLHEQVRENDLVVRYGGDEFLIVLPETNGELQMITKRIQQAVAKRNKENPLLDFPVTLSIGAAHWEPKSDLTIEQVLAKADERMYQEKKRSTN